MYISQRDSSARGYISTEAKGLTFISRFSKWMLVVSKDLALMEAEEQTEGKEGGRQAWKKRLLDSGNI